MGGPKSQYHSLLVILLVEVVKINMHLKGAYEVLNERITVDFFENYHNTVIKFLYKYHHRSIFYQKLYFPVTVGRL